MPNTTPPSQAAPPRCTALTLLRDLLITVALCYLITLGLLYCIELHLALFFPLASCEQPNTLWAADFRAYQRALAAITHVDVLRVTTGCSVLAFAVAELGLAVARRARMPGDTERGLASASNVVTEKQLENPFAVPPFA
ncbi:hypothetical protein B0H10DRAFT_2234613 [Mycena sp. CBHHK59/15]|nr:hypothetical protein B0H10DRAFT_2234613 [Mycena sp. CBHHK59/15]